MKTTTQQLMKSLLMSLLLVSPMIHAQARDSLTKEPAFGVSMYMDAQRKMDLRIDARQSRRIIIVLKDAKNTIIYRECLKRSQISYWRKFNFDESESGTYQFEISDDRQTIVRRIEVVDLPVVEPQRYIVYGTLTSL